MLSWKSQSNTEVQTHHPETTQSNFGQCDLPKILIGLCWLISAANLAHHSLVGTVSKRYEGCINMDPTDVQVCK